MFDKIVEGLAPYLEAGFIDISSTTLGDDTFAVKAGPSAILVKVTSSSIEVMHGENQGTVLNGVTPDQAVRFIIQALGRKDFVVPPAIVSRFNQYPFPEKVTSAVLAPVGITSGDLDGQNFAVYRDAHGRYYIHQDECRISLMLYKELYDRNSEGELLLLPKLFQSETPPVLKRDFTMISESTAQAALGRYGLPSFIACSAKGIPVRISSAIVPASGVCSFGGERYQVSEMAEKFMGLASAWEEALTGKKVEKAKPLAFSSVSVDVGRDSASSDRVEMIFEFSAPWADGSVFTETKKMVISKAEAREIVQKVGPDYKTSNAAVVAELLTKVASAAPVTVSGLKQPKQVSVVSSVVAEVKSVNDKTSIFSSVNLKGAAADLDQKDFVKQNAVPDWLSECGKFAIVSMRQ